MKIDDSIYRNTVQYLEDEAHRIAEFQVKLQNKVNIEEVIKIEEERIDLALKMSIYLLQTLLNAEEVNITVNFTKDEDKIIPHTKITVKMNENKIK